MSYPSMTPSRVLAATSLMSTLNLTSLKVCICKSKFAVDVLIWHSSIPTSPQGRHIPCPWWHADSGIQSHRDRSRRILYSGPRHCYSHRLVHFHTHSLHPLIVSQRVTPSSAKTRNQTSQMLAMMILVAVGSRWPKSVNSLSCRCATHNCSSPLVSNLLVVF